MEYNLYFDLSAIMITLVILFASVISKWIPTNQNRAYRNLVGAIFLTALFDFITLYLENDLLGKVPWYFTVKFITDSLYHLFHVMTGMFFFWFSLGLLNLRPDTPGRRTAMFGPMAATQVLLVLNIFLPVVFYYNGQGLYERAPLIIIIYILGFGYLAMSLSVLIRHRKMVNVRIIRIMGSYALMGILGVLIQTLYPHLMVGEFFNALAMIMMYADVESPDEIKNEKYQVITREGYLRQTAGDIGSKNPFVSIFVHVIDMHETSIGGDEYMHEALMKEIIRFLKKYKKEAWIAVWNESCIVLDLSRYSEKRTQEILDEIENRFHQPWLVEGITQSAGLIEWSVRYPKDISTIEELVKKTEMLNDVHLHRHRGQICFPEVDFEELSYSQKMMDLAIDAIHKHTAQVRYEPLLEVSTDQIIAARAVIYFPDENGQYVNGNAFVNPSSQSATLTAFDEYALNDAAKNHRILMRDTQRRVISTRFSASTIMAPNVKERFARICEREQMNYRKILLRISDGVFSSLNEEQLQRLNQMRQEGWGIAIDDFGMGQFFLSRLTDSSIPDLLLHNSITQSIFTTENAVKFGIGIIYTIHGMNKLVTMSGIKDEEQARLAKNMGADYITGPYLAEPMLPEEFQEWMKERAANVVQ